MIVECSEEFLDRGKEKVKRALENYKRFFVDGEDITQNIIKLRL
jgi:O-phosphoseryl-tRNA(Cys) synthetase